jgi:hypothetical protein
MFLPQLTVGIFFHCLGLLNLILFEVIIISSSFPSVKNGTRSRELLDSFNPSSVGIDHSPFHLHDHRKTVSVISIGRVYKALDMICKSFTDSHSFYTSASEVLKNT